MGVFASTTPSEISGFSSSSYRGNLIHQAAGKERRRRHICGWRSVTIPELKWAKLGLGQGEWRLLYLTVKVKSSGASLFFLKKRCHSLELFFFFEIAKCLICGSCVNVPLMNSICHPSDSRLFFLGNQSPSSSHGGAGPYLPQQTLTKIKTAVEDFRMSPA